MTSPVFFTIERPLSLAEIIAATGVRAADNADLSIAVSGVAALDEAEPGDLAVAERPADRDLLATTRATACFVAPCDLSLVPKSVIALATGEPRRAFALALARLFPNALCPASVFASVGVNPGASIHPEARLEPGVIVDPGAVIGPRAEIGSGSIVAANCVVGPDVRIGRDCSIGAQSTLAHALLGNRVLIHPGARIGQAGCGSDDFGARAIETSSPRPPQIGRVIIQDGVEIGANATIDRGGIRDTVIGEGAYIGNLASVAQDVMIGRHCCVLAQASIGASAGLGDFVLVESKASFAGGLRIGAGARISAQSRVISDVPDAAHFGGSPARPLRLWLRALATLDWLAKAKPHLSPRRD